ncbi:hypothetical protein [Parabacteroides pacaensis]|uniref:hypothetical protein n=1 Tax=Parabacteroides pacaensis TaxID=2086575 RepID=UPI000D101961|nr:hypothetical protein [Parabacteroides pacaensis]
MNQLTKTSTNSEIKDYFNAVLKLAKASEEFPVNLDEVWPLVYGRKSDAAEALQRDFMQDVDYRVLRQNPQNSLGGRPTNDYLLTVSCMEFFIARKVRAVFEVYRQVFHKTAERAKVLKAPTIRERIAAADWLARFLNMNDNSKLQLAKTIAEPLGLPTPDYTESKNQLLSATELLKRAGVGMNARDFNIKMKEKGFITELERPSHKGIKKFKSLTGAGLNYGENQVNPGNPKETQPLYYADKFIELLAVLELKTIA